MRDECVDLTEEGFAEDFKKQLADVEAELQAVETEIRRLYEYQKDLHERRDNLRQMVEVEQRAPKADWQGTFRWDADVVSTMQSMFSLQSFRPLQREVINATLQGRDVLVLMPSGGGKSLCYQLPALLAPGVTLVVSPLLSLIQDQVLGLTSINIPAVAMTSLSSKEEINTIYKRLDDPSAGIRLLYATPERIVNAKRFMAKLEKLYKSGRLNRIAIDEAHCCSQWGNDFRPDYKKLGVLKQQFPDVPLLALTATATARVCEDLKEILRIHHCETFKNSVNRPNLMYEVREKGGSSESVVDDMVRWIQRNYPAKQSGIVYCLARKDCEAVAQDLTSKGISSSFYHADMDPHAREAAHRKWSQGRVQVIVATIAFGMGINKPDVRFVIHHSLSKSLENYYQESGRAGRDGAPAHCLLYYKLADVLRQAAVVSMDLNWEPNLSGIMKYCSAVGMCRRAVICRHFAEAPSACHCMCDNCCNDSSAIPERDVTDSACAMLRVLKQWPATEKRATLIQLIDKWKASKRSDGSKHSKDMMKEDAEYLAGRLLLLGCLQLDFGYTAYATTSYLKLGPKANTILDGHKRLAMRFPPRNQPEAPAAGGGTANNNKLGADSDSQLVSVVTRTDPEDSSKPLSQGEQPGGGAGLWKAKGSGRVRKQVVIDSDSEEDVVMAKRGKRTSG